MKGKEKEKEKKERHTKKVRSKDSPKLTAIPSAVVVVVVVVKSIATDDNWELW